MKTRGVIYDTGTVYGTGLIRLRAQYRTEGYFDASG
jgi:hypothetical protein